MALGLCFIPQNFLGISRKLLTPWCKYKHARHGNTDVWFPAMLCCSRVRLLLLWSPPALRPLNFLLHSW